MSNIQVSAFRWVPPFAQGLVRDLPVRWALEEAGRNYDEQLIGPDDQKSASYRQRQPFGQVPAIDDDGLVLFESGAIVLHIAEQSAALMPADHDDRARVKTWMFAAVSTIEPPIMMLNVIDMLAAGQAQDLRAKVVGMIDTRLENLATFLGNRDYLIGDRFTAADLLMTTVLRILRTTELVQKGPSLEAYTARCEARPAFQKALGAQLRSYANAK